MLLSRNAKHFFFGHQRSILWKASRRKSARHLQELEGTWAEPVTCNCQVSSSQPNCPSYSLVAYMLYSHFITSVKSGERSIRPILKIFQSYLFCLTQGQQDEQTSYTCMESSKLKVIVYSVLMELNLLLRFQYLTALLSLPQMPNLFLMFDLGYDYISVCISNDAKSFACISRLSLIVLFQLVAEENKSDGSDNS